MNEILMELTANEARLMSETVNKSKTFCPLELCLIAL